MYSLAVFWKHSPRITSNQAPDPDPGAAAKDPHVAPARSTFQCIQAIHVIRDSCSMRTATVHARRLRTAKQAASLPNFITWPPHHLLEDVRWLTVRPLMSTKHVSVTRMHSTFSSLSRQSGSLPFYKARVLVHTVTLKKKLTIIAFSALPHVARLRGSLVHRWFLLTHTCLSRTTAFTRGPTSNWRSSRKPQARALSLKPVLWSSERRLRPVEADER
jgi:hypothetical protein